MNLAIRYRLAGLALDAAIVCAYWVVGIAAGHGVGTIGYLMLNGSFGAWGLPMVLGWVAIGAFVAAVLIPKRWIYGLVLLLALALLGTSWGLFVSETELFAVSFPASLAFVGLATVRFPFLCRHLLSRTSFAPHRQGEDRGD